LVESQVDRIVILGDSVDAGPFSYFGNTLAE
jgi:hypothetical protein